MKLRTLVPVVIALLISSVFISEVAFGKEKSPQVYRMQIKPHWDKENKRFWYRNDGPQGQRDFVLVDTRVGKREAAFDHERVAELLADTLDEQVDTDRLPVDSLTFCPNQNCLDLVGSQGSWRLNRNTYELKSLTDGEATKGLPFTREIRASKHTGAEVYITFVNQLKIPVELYWLDSSGERKAYGQVKAGEQRRQHTFAGHMWLVTRKNGDIIAVFEAVENGGRAIIDGREPTKRPTPRNRDRNRGEETFVVSPDGKLQAFVRDHNLWIREVQTKKEWALSVGGNPNHTYHRDAQRSRLVGMQYQKPDYPASLPDVRWSPDSRYIVALRTKAVTPRTVYMVESSPKDQLQPKLHSYPYLKPGDDIPISLPHLFDVQAKREIALDHRRIANPWTIGDIRWMPDSSYFTFIYNQRGHQVMQVFAVSVPHGELRLIVDEQCDTFFHYSGKMFTDYLPKTQEMIWMSERAGWNHLYLINMKTGKVKNAITQGKWVVRKVEKVDKEKRQVYFQAGGVVSRQDPYYIHYCRVDFDGSNFVCLTEGDGHHSVQWSPDRKTFIDTWSRVDMPPIHALRSSADGRLLCKLEQADASEVLDAWGCFPERFVAKARDGKTDIYGIVHRPNDLDTKIKIPIIEYIYAGPHSAFVPKSFRSSYGQRRMVDRGFVVVQIDGMGTSHRSKAFHDVCWQNLVDGGFPDRILWIKALAKKYPYLDISRVGIYGGSAGGQNALGALLTHGEFYKVGSADCGCHDNRMDKIWWNEQWMGWPVGPHYTTQSNVILAPQLQGKLLLIVGELDRNVDPASTMQVVDALVRADKDFDMLIIPGAGHGAAGTAYGRRRQQDFFVEHLIGTNED